MTPLSEKGRKIGSAGSTPFSAVAAIRCEPSGVAAYSTPVTNTASPVLSPAVPVNDDASPQAAAPGPDFPAPNTLCETGPIFQAAGNSGTHVVVPQVFFSMNTSPVALSPPGSSDAVAAGAALPLSPPEHDQQQPNAPAPAPQDRASPRQQPSPAPANSFPQYRGLTIEKQIASSGQAIVYKGVYKGKMLERAFSYSSSS
jgi:hypothetical protein